MANSNFQLQPSLANFLEGYKNEKAFTSDDLEELRSHLLDAHEELQSKGLSAEEAFWLATKRLGPQKEVANEFQKLERIPKLSVETFWIIYGLLVFTILAQVWGISRILDQYFAFTAKTNFQFLVLRLCTILPVCVAGYILIVNRRVFNWIENRFSLAPLQLSLFTFFSSDLIWLCSGYVQGFFARLLHNQIKIHSTGNTYIIPNTFSDLVYFVPVLLILFVFTRLFYPTIKNKKLGSMFDRVGYIGLFLLGFIVNFLAALSRLIGGGTPMLLQTVLFALIFGTCIYLATRAFTHKVLMRVLLLASFTLVGEFVASWVNPALTMGTPLSVFFYAAVIGGLLGYQAGRRR